MTDLDLTQRTPQVGFNNDKPAQMFNVLPL